MTEPCAEKLGHWLARALDAEAVRIVGTKRLTGGAIQENWRIDAEIEGADGPPRRALVLRRDPPATIGSSLGREQEFEVLRVVHRAGVKVPEPIAFCRDADVIGAPFALTAFVPGTAFAPRIIKDKTLGGERTALTQMLGGQLARIHSLRAPVAGLEFLGTPAHDPVEQSIAKLREALDRLGVRRPALEWGLRWAELNASACRDQRLLHNDFRTGNYIVDETGLAAILDWEFAGYGDPMADLGWFCGACWRFGCDGLEAGGIGDRADFYAGYEAESGTPVDDAAVRFWEVLSHLRWAVIALEQGHRHLSGVQRSLELALTGRLVPELELAVLRSTAPESWRRTDG
jgi:aminoglycoside phosphotransferase (APT) family kinase protein